MLPPASNNRQSPQVTLPGMALKILVILSVTSSPGKVLGIWGGETLREVERERSDRSRRGRVVVTTGDWFQDYPPSPAPRRYQNPRMHESLIQNGAVQLALLMQRRNPRMQNQMYYEARQPTVMQLARQLSAYISSIFWNGFHTAFRSGHVQA